MAGRNKPLVVITRKLPDQVETRMRELFDARLNLDDRPLSKAELVAAVKEATVLVPTITDRIDAELIEHAGPNFKLIANFGNGVDNIDVVAATKKGLTVTNTPNVLNEDTADMTMALMLAVPRRLTEGANVLKGDGKWPGWSPTWMLGRRIWGKRLGIVGMGRIGTAVARRAKAFGLSIHYHNRHRVARPIEDELEATYWESLDQMLARMDIISVNCPSTPATFHLLSARRLALMQPSAYIVNTARGDIIDEDTLIRLIQEGKIAGAGLDVFQHEPAVNPKLVKLAVQGQGRDPAAYGFGDHGRPHRHGREGDRQHPRLHRRPSPAGPGPAEPGLKFTQSSARPRRPPRGTRRNLHADVRSSLTATGVVKPISRATIRPSSRIASGSCSTSAAGAWPACTSSSSTAEADDEPIVPGTNSTRAGNVGPALRVSDVGDAAALRIDAAPEADRRGEHQRVARAAGTGHQDLRLDRLPLRRAHAPNSVTTGRPVTALSTQSASEA